MTVLAEALGIGDADLADAGDTAEIVVDAALAPGTFQYPFLRKLDEEVVSVYSGADTTTWSIHRAQERTLAAAHDAGTELSSPFSGGSGGVTLVESVEDPGAIGAGNLWVRLDPSETYPPSLYIRDSTDTDWVDNANAGQLLSQGLSVYDEFGNVRTILEMTPGSVHLTVRDGDDIELAQIAMLGSQRIVEFSTGGGGGAQLALTLNGFKIMTSADGVVPSAGAGIAAPLGSLYLYSAFGTVGRVYVKTGAADTAWGVFGDMSGSVDPSAGAGVPADLGSLYRRVDGGAAELWFKNGFADTDWTQVSTI